MFRVLLLLATFMQVYFNLLNLQQMIIINAFHGLRRRRLIAIQLHRRILRRRRRRHRPRFWRLPRPMNSWFEIHYNDPLIPDDYFKEQLRVRKETFEVILNHLNPHLTREDKAMHDYHQRKCLLLDFIDSSVCLQTWCRHIIDSSPLFFTSFARYDPQDIGSFDLMSCEARMSLSPT